MTRDRGSRYLSVRVELEVEPPPNGSEDELRLLGAELAARAAELLRHDAEVIAVQHTAAVIRQDRSRRLTP